MKKLVVGISFLTIFTVSLGIYVSKDEKKRRYMQIKRIMADMENKDEHNPANMYILRENKIESQ
ncbi:hypothetical protein GHJ48_13290 [Acinetobacter sp. dk771]|uniref:Uncharacterized protein n=1 Tax=Acinetobacter wanghuae TaxID=2662362 RepID=A0AA90W9Q3_9GAMM|nr:hypothetical protein [Acinetobacter wanghuae]MQW93349.1 hypothetical protein [Acinetobacter wanghuae]